jgi:hypothetical protein
VEQLKIKMEQQQAQQEQTAITRMSGIGADALQVRLNPEPLLNQIELFLRGERLHYEHDANTGETKIVKKSCGKPLANDIGTQMVLSWVTLIMNTQTVQGNIQKDEQNRLMVDLKLGLAYNLMTCYKEWGIDKNNRRFINRAIENCCRLYVSRALENKERESYGQSIVHKESNSLRDNRKMPPINPQGAM